MEKKCIRFFTLWQHENQKDGPLHAGSLSIFADGSTRLEAGDLGLAEAQAAFLSCEMGNDTIGGYSWVDDTASLLG